MVETSSAAQFASARSPLFYSNADFTLPAQVNKLVSQHGCDLILYIVQAVLPESAPAFSVSLGWLKGPKRPRALLIFKLKLCPFLRFQPAEIGLPVAHKALVYGCLRLQELC